MRTHLEFDRLVWVEVLTVSRCLLDQLPAMGKDKSACGTFRRGRHAVDKVAEDDLKIAQVSVVVPLIPE